MRLIDADEFESYLINRYGGNDTADDIIEDLYNQPTVDAVERKKGKWIKISITDDGYAINYRCSCCKGDDVKYPWKYCPNCGSDMRGEANE